MTLILLFKYNLTMTPVTSNILIIFVILKDKTDSSVI